MLLPYVLTTAVTALSMYLVSIKNVLFNLFILILIYISQYIFLCSWGQCVLITVLIHLSIETRGASLYWSDRLLTTLLLFGERFSSTEKNRNQNASNHNEFVYFTIPTMTNLFVILKITFFIRKQKIMDCVDACAFVLLRSIHILFFGQYCVQSILRLSTSWFNTVTVTTTEISKRGEWSIRFWKIEEIC